MPLISRLGSFSSGAFGFGKPSSPSPGPSPGPSPAGGLVVEYLLVGGGGGGGASCEGGGGGGGGGEVREGCTTLYDGINYNVITGRAGPSAGPAIYQCLFYANFPDTGGYSCLGDIYAAGGARGGGMSYTYAQIYSGQPGVTNIWDPYAPLGGQGGGGGANCNPGGPAFCNTAGGYYYYDSLPSGGAGLIGPAPLYPYRNGGGGGGGGGLGGDANTTCGGEGGIGATSCITGVLCYYGGGGGGGSNRPGTGALGGCGGGGRGGTCVCTSTNGTIYTGGGGGGGAFPPPPTPTPNPVFRGSGTGGSGGIIIAYPSACGNIPYFFPPNLVRCLDTTTRPGYNVYFFCQHTGTILFNYGSAILSCILVVAGGGGGGANGQCMNPSTIWYGMGGGGGGGLINTGAGLCRNVNYTISIGAGAPITPATNPLTLGCGGDGLNGSNTSIIGPNLSLIALGGGGGGGGFCKPGLPGGSGGGSGTGSGQPALNVWPALGGLDCLNRQGTNGATFTNGGSGGGGALLAGGGTPSYPGSTNGGVAGLGCTLSITGTPVIYGSGGAGGGGCCGGCQCGNGGCGGSNACPFANRSGTSGAANLGGGGGGAAGAGPAPTVWPTYLITCPGNGGGGGSGVLILRYPYPTYPAISCVSPGLTYACSTSVPGVLIYCFTAGTGTICFV